MNQPSNHLSFRECTLSDLDTLIQISKDTFIAAFEAENEPEDFREYIESAFSKEQLQKELLNQHSQFFFVFENVDLVGYFKVNKDQAQTDVKDKDSLELERIYVVGHHQGKGIGAWMLQQVIDLAKDNGMDYVWLGVWEHNPGAIRFYQKYGFTKFGTHPYYIGDDQQTDWLLRLML
ncbi:GNAT family N-acetyltransferase [Flagellimonas algicola]|uniref:GNAT family N-acetyltransferase n=1 Tax=Flagellimonas algicola TaxID=2583815 RepID=A0ABY2WJH1_9FLAO|nr:GNAT family N-acetyltransferase [Allomuricauda algicola]TMU54988.1 GNAT family N-acetyltransferase [Allomuricauda algicola]